MAIKKAQIVYFSHGGGPLPILGDPGHKSMNDFMTKLPEIIEKPEAIIVLSAHWEESVVTIQSGKSPSMIYDYYGFPEEAYSIKYPANGSPKLAREIADILSSSDINHKLDENRGYDHGLYIPLKMMYPDADIPCFQISLLRSLDERAHINLGIALRALMDKNVLVIGSGFSFHNMRAFSFNGRKEIDPENSAFQEWITKAATKDISWEKREQKLIDWESAPYARYCHPRSEHLLPLHVCIGMAGEKGKLIFDDYIAGKRAVAFLWD